EEALSKLTGRISLKKPELTDQFMDLNTGALAALRNVEGYSHKTREALAPLYAHLPAAVRTRLAMLLQQRITNQTAGGHSLRRNPDGSPHHRGARVPSEQVQDAIYWICEAHNAWVAEDPSRGSVIDLSQLHTKSGMEEALSKLTGRISLKKPELTDQFMDLNTGALAALRNVAGYSQKTTEALAPLYAHLPAAVRTRLDRLLQQRLTNKTAGSTSLNRNPDGSPYPGGRSASEQVQDAIYWICEAHNAWVTEDPSRGSAIDLSQLHTKSGMEEALARLGAAQSRD
ncbi:MAG: hypothetical protein HY537_18120, partial [Deltaproteobacteria bacterium]|nr:hypothetical protein [Deltaproteobacteria bacterium]